MTLKDTVYLDAAYADVRSAIKHLNRIANKDGGLYTIGSVIEALEGIMYQYIASTYDDERGV